MAIVNTLKINFDKKANLHATFRNNLETKTVAELSHTVTHTQAFTFIESNKAESFLFRIDPMKSKKAQAKLIAQIEALGFTVEPSHAAHYNQYAWR